MRTILKKPLLTAFGTEAEKIASRCSNDTSVLFCDGSNVSEALAEAVRHRREGDHYLVAPLMRDRLSVVARLAAITIYEQIANLDERRQLFEQVALGSLSLNHIPISQHHIYVPEVFNTMSEIFQLGDGLFVRSTTERMRLEYFFSKKRLYVAVAPLIDTTIPDVHAHRDANRVVVWAPDEDAMQLAIYSYALWHLKQPAIFVCKGEIPDSPHYFVHPEQATDALRHASVIIDTQLTDPGTAIAFAGKGYGLATASTSGAHEYIQGVATYTPHDFTSIYGAVTRARSDRRAFTLPMVSATELIHSTIDAAKPQIPEKPPLVSVVIPTYNRPTQIRGALESLRKQSYPNIEAIVVNDCGEDISNIVADFPFARYFCLEKNSGCSAAVNYGLHQASGAFIGVVADDDRNYVDQISSLAAALIDSGVDAAHGNIVMRLETLLEDGSVATYGHLLQFDGDHDAYSVYWGLPISAQSYLVRRDVWERINYFDEELICSSDLEMTMKLTKCCDFTHVNLVNGEMAYRDDKSNMSSRVGDKLAPEIRSTQILHAPPDSALIAERIQQNFLYMQESAKLPTYFYPWERLENPIPVES